MDLASIWLILKLIETRGAPPGPRPDPTQEFANGAPREPGPRGITNFMVEEGVISVILKDNHKTTRRCKIKWMDESWVRLESWITLLFFTAIEGLKGSEQRHFDVLDGLGILNRQSVM